MFYKVRKEDWTEEEITADMMIELDEELIFAENDVGIIARMKKADVRFVIQTSCVFFNYSL